MKTSDEIAQVVKWTPATTGRYCVMSLGTFAAVVSLVACLHLTLWALRNPNTNAPSVEGRLPSVSYNRFAEPSPDGLRVPEVGIRADLTAIARYAKAVRTYASTQGLERVPEIAAELGLTVTLGVWLDKDKARNEREIAAALDLARRYPNVTRLVVGNETVYLHELTVPDLIKIVRRVKRDSPIPVGSAENWQTFIEHPEFGDAVDQIFAHIIPYWEGFPKETAVQESMAIYDKLRAAYPNKKIVIGEFGWPSAGHNFESAVPSPITQAVILRDFAARANASDIDYNIVEAIDQPEKLFEGNVGPYWGIFDASLRPKFSWTGPIVDPNYWKTAWLAVLVGSLLSITILVLPGATFSQATLLAAADHLFGGWCAGVLVYWHGHYLLHGEMITFAIALPLLGLLAPIVSSRLNEMAAVALGRGPARLLQPSSPMPRACSPKVSIHIPACREPPDMLLQTVDSVARLDYPNFQCVVVINNTPDPAFWQPIEARCRELGSRF
jgi:exo-beta-1,3-glucanase (GH17 family)